MFRVLITGATGKMGLETVKAVIADSELQLAGALGNNSFVGEDIGILAVGKETGILVKNNFSELITESKPDIVVDLTNAGAAYSIIMTCLDRGVSCISGSTGFSHEQLDEIKRQATEKNLTIMLIPNFSIGAVLMMKFAEQASKHFNNVEIIEMHHEKKKDSPSGTAIKTAEMMLKNSSDFNNNLPEATVENIEGSRGGKLGNINIHSIRMPGFVASQEVIFGGIGQLLKIRHDTINREAFMPGLIFAIKQSRIIKGYTYGLDTLL